MSPAAYVRNVRFDDGESGFFVSCVVSLGGKIPGGGMVEK